MSLPRPFPKDHPGHDFPSWVSSTYRRPRRAMPTDCGHPDCPACSPKETS